MRLHTDLRIAVRDGVGVDEARRFTSQVVLTADIVDVVGPAVVAAHAEPRYAGDPRRLLSSDGTLFLLRRDAERAGTQASPRGVDWSDLFPGFGLQLVIAAAEMSLTPSRLSDSVHRRWALRARHLLLQAVALMRYADRVVTDRLHGAIVARIAGRPVTLIDNSYGKLAAYREAWWRDDSSIAIEYPVAR